MKSIYIMGLAERFQEFLDRNRKKNWEKKVFGNRWVLELVLLFNLSGWNEDFTYDPLPECSSCGLYVHIDVQKVKIRRYRFKIHNRSI